MMSPDPTPIDGLARGSDMVRVDADITEANRDPELATAWTKLKAIQNYENFHNKTFDTDSKPRHSDRDYCSDQPWNQRLGVARVWPRK